MSIEVIEYSFLIDSARQATAIPREQRVADSKAVRLDIIDFSKPATIQWLRDEPEVVLEVEEALLASESRPRSAVFDTGALVALRGINRNEGANPEDMISVRVWLTEDHIIIAQRRGLRSIVQLVAEVESGRIAPHTSDILLRLMDLLADQIGDFVDTLEDNIDAIDDGDESAGLLEHRHQVAELRRDVAAVRRYLYPQRDALERLVRAEIPALPAGFGRALGERVDRITRYVEDLDLARERLMMLREEAAAQLAAEQNARMYLLAIVTTVFLPLGFVTGLFGINVGGMPGIDNDAAFYIVVAGLLVVTIGVMLLLRWKRWF